MSFQEPILAYQFDENGGGAAIDSSNIGLALENDLLAWVHLDINHSDTEKSLKKELTYLDSFIIEALLEDETRPRATQIGDGILVVLRGVNLNKNEDPEDMVSIRLWIDSHRIISLQKRTLQVIFDIEKKLKIGKGPKNAGQFISILIAHLTDRIEPVLSDIDEMMVAVEETILNDSENIHRDRIVDIRKKIILLRRYIAPQKEAIGQLQLTELSWLNPTQKRHLHESYNRLLRFVEDIDSIRERAQIIKDEIINTLSEKLNKNMYTISTITAIFLPLGFLTGLLGVNIAGIPGTDISGAFWIFCAILIILVLIQILLFRIFRWF